MKVSPTLNQHQPMSAQYNWQLAIKPPLSDWRLNLHYLAMSELPQSPTYSPLRYNMSSESTSKVTVNWWLANVADISLKSAFIGGGEIILYDFF